MTNTEILEAIHMLSRTNAELSGRSTILTGNVNEFVRTFPPARPKLEERRRERM